MKYAFFGTPDFAAVILEKLVAFNFPPTLVVCNPDRPVGRKHIITPPPTKVLAKKYKIPIFQPETLVNFKFPACPAGRQILPQCGIPPSGTNSKFDFFVVAAYAKIITKEILAIPRLGAIGVHPSLLPKYRGPSPIQSAILNGDSETGVSLFLIDEKVDHGETLIIGHLPIEIDDTYETLNKKLAELGADLLIKTLPKFIKDEITPLPQDENKATYTKKFITEDGYVDLQKDKPAAIERKIRALNPEPGVYALMEIKSEKKRVKFLESELVDGKLKLTKIQVEGGKPQNICRII